MRALGIDPGTRNLGWGVVDRSGNRLIHCAHGVIRLRAEDGLSVRLAGIFEQLRVVIAEYKPQIGSVEQIFFHKDPQSAAKLGHARGVVLLALEQAGVSVREHAPSRVKRTLTGNGQADKSQVGQMVQAILGLGKLPPADASDALALALTELRLESRAVLLEVQRKRNLRKKMPEHLAALLKKAQLERAEN